MADSTQLQQATVELMNTMAPYFDRHMLVRLLTFHAKRPNGDTFNQGLQKLLAQTNLFSQLRDVAANEKEIAAIDEKAARIEKKMEQLRATSAPLTSHFFDTDAETKRMTLKVFHRQIDEMSRSGKIAELNLKKAEVDATFELGQMLADAGSYSEAAALFFVVHKANKDISKVLPILWARLLCDTLADEWTQVLGDIRALRETLEPETATPSQLVWLLHWSLFYYFKRQPAADPAALLEHISSVERSDKAERDYTRDRQKFLYGNALQSLAPHLLRYVAVAAILSKKKAHLKRIARMCELESTSSDPFVRFVDLLCSESNSRAASQLLASIQSAAAADFFLADLSAEIVNAARMMIFEESLHIHKSVSISAAAERLGMTADKTEAWIVDVISEAKFDATIDSVNRMVNVNIASQTKTVWRQVQSVLEKATRNATAAGSTA